MALLEVNDLHIRLQTQRGPAEAVRGISFSLERGETMGIVGESGCGKSITVMSLMGLLPASAKVGGSIRFDGTELVGLDERAMCGIRGNRIGMIFQERHQRALARRGSSRSRKPSPSRLSPSTASAMAMPGHTASSGDWNIIVCASLSMRPHEGCGGWVPRPR